MLRRIGMLGLAVLLLTSLFSSRIAMASESSTDELQEQQAYEIYPLPHHQSYYGSSFSLSDDVNLVLDDRIDEPTRNLLGELLQAKSITSSQSEEVVTGKNNIIIGIKGSGSNVSTYLEQQLVYGAEVFEQIDAHVLDIQKKTGEPGNISILADSTDSAYYALVTLRLIMEQEQGRGLQTLKIEDYADTKFRGFIEGFYGFPWSHEDRKSLMEFGGKFKMNTYIFAPKDDQYHNSAWRTLYPADELAKIKELVDAGEASKTKFVWAIHPGFNMINWNNYDNELQTLLKKLEQLYSVGVRQFGLFMDDISTSQSLTDRDKHVKLITDVANWASSKSDVKNLIYCPPFYNQGWTGEGGKPYLQALRAVPENVDIVWTGKGVVGTVNETDMQWVKNEIGRDPYVWLNWPVNDYRDARLMLGKGEVLKPGTHNISGVVSNPMGQAELSKIALFAVADFTWNVDHFSDTTSWLDSFKYIVPEASEELKQIAYHLSDPSPSGHGLVVGESENIKEQLEQFLTNFSNGSSVSASGEQLIASFNQVLQAIDSFKAKSQNKKMVDEITPWLNSLQEVLKADKYAAQSAISLQKGDLGAAWEGLAKATSAMAESKKFQIKKLKYPDVTVEAGAKRLVPFAEQLIMKLDGQIYAEIDPDYVIKQPIHSYSGVSGANLMVDGDENTYVYFQIQQKNGDWYGLDLGKVITVRDIAITQGRNDQDHDIFQRGVLEYSEDGQSWTAIGEERQGHKIAERNLELEARYVRYRLTHAGIPGGKPDLWTSVREFSVNKKESKAVMYTNVAELEDATVTTTASSIALSERQAITLQSKQYIGVKLPAIEQLASVQLALSSTDDDLALEASMNGVEWTKQPLEGPYQKAAYIRLINHGEQPITFDINRFMLELNKFLEPVVSHNYNGLYSGKIEQVYDGKLENKVWFNSEQRKGKYVQVDMGGIVDVQNVAVVINDGEGDYFRSGDLQLSLDGKQWEKIHSFSNPQDRSLNFPDHEVPYRYKRVQVDQKQARYVRLISTGDYNAWLALNEIIVNEGMGRPGQEQHAISVSMQGGTGHEALYAIDGKLSSYYTPAGEGLSGELTYKLSQETQLEEIILMQSPQQLSQASIQIRDMKGWHEAGVFSQSLQRVDTSKYEQVLELKLQWTKDNKPQIHEIIPVKKKGSTPQPKGAYVQIKGASSVTAGENYSAELTLYELPENIYAFDATIKYDPNILTVQEVLSMQENVQLVDTVKQAEGELRIIAFSSAANHIIASDKALLQVKFSSVPQEGTKKTEIAIIEAILGDGTGAEHEAERSSIFVDVIKGNTGVPGDVNQDGKVTIGDLAIIAAHYGKDHTSPDWDKVKHADLNSDGIIDLQDLVLAARSLLEY